jgi:hypothetical protein
MAEFNYIVLIHQIDVFLAELGTSGMVDGDKARDQLIDLRLMCTAMEEEKNTDPPPAPLVADPAMLTEILRP